MCVCACAALPALQVIQFDVSSDTIRKQVRATDSGGGEWGRHGPGSRSYARSFLVFFMICFMVVMFFFMMIYRWFSWGFFYDDVWMISVGLPPHTHPAPPSPPQVTTELRTLYGASHPHIVKYYQSFFDNGAITILVEYMDGGALADILKGKRVPEKYVAEIGRQVCQGF